MSEFYEFPNLIGYYRRELGDFKLTQEKVLHEYMRSAIAADSKASQSFGVWQEEWFEGKRPYYQVWPRILPVLLKIDISKVQIPMVRLPHGLRCLYIKLPKGNALDGGGKDIQGIMVRDVHIEGKDGIYIGAFDGVEEEWQIPRVDTWVMQYEDQTVSEELESIREMSIGDTITVDAYKTVFPLVVTLCLIGNDSDVLEEILLSKLETRREAATAEELKRLVEKSKQRGRYGWHVGRNMTVSPHQREPHNALYWTGKGRQIPKIVFRSGSFVKRRQITDVPTGYLDE